MSCSNLDRHHSKEILFETQEVMELQKVSIDEVLRPVDMILTDDYYVIQNDIMDNMDMFFVYDRESLRFLYSFMQRGLGPDETLAPALVQNSINNQIMIIDQANGRLLTFMLAGAGVSKVSEDLIERQDKSPLQEVYLCGDSVLIYNTIENEIQTYSLKTHQIIDSFSFRNNLKSDLGQDYNKNYDSFHFSVLGNRIGVAFRYIDKLSVGQLTEDFRIVMEEPSFMVGKKIDTRRFKQIIYYPYIELTENGFMAQFAGYELLKMQPFPLNMGKREFKFDIEVYDKTGEPRKILKMEEDILRCKYDAKNHRLFTWNPLEDFDSILFYNIVI